MTVRPPSQPPPLDGYEYLGLLGSGGFADVFRYQQLRPRREVAVKVLLRDLGANAQHRFEDEANLMAMLSSHPSIVSIFAAGVAADGRPYLVMENCRPQHLGALLRQKPLPVGKALEIGIQVAGAVETAHRLSILHRDIKPANILFTDFGRPALTDFGISVAEGGQGAAAFSVAWAQPEQIESRPMGPSEDVYSLAATVWAMLTGRNPYVVPGGGNRSHEILARKQQPVPPTGRPGVPESLERVLRTALARLPEQRYGSALEFARALQGVQAELHQSVTTIDVREDRASDGLADEGETGTVFTNFTVIDPDSPPERTDPGWVDVSDSRGTRPTGFTGEPGGSGGAGGAGVTGGTAPGGTPTARPVLVHGRGSKPAHAPLDFTGPAIPQVPADDTYVAGSPPAIPDAAPAVPTPRRLLPALVGVGAVVVVGGLTAAWVVGGGGAATSGATPSSTTTVRPADPVGASVPKPTEGRAVAQGGTVTFTWANPAPKDGDRYLYRPILLDREVPLAETTAATATVPAQTGKTCLDVQLVQTSGQASDFTRVCTP